MHIAVIQNVSFTDHRMVHTDNIARELIARGYQVDVIINDSVQKTSSHHTPYTIINLPGETYSFLGQIRFIHGVYDVLRKKKYDIIHAKNPFSSALPSLFKRPKSKIIYDIRGLWIDFGVYAGHIPKQMAHVLNKVDIYCMNKADAVIAISNELRKMLIGRGVNSDKIKVIVGDGVNIASQADKKDIRKFLNTDCKIVGYVGTISRTRNSEKIIKAFSILQKKIGNYVHLVLIGPISNGEKNYFHSLINELKLEDIITLTGVIPHDIVLKFLASFDVAISYHEKDLPLYNVAVPTKILEYLAAGCVIVTTDQIMYKNILTHEKDAILTSQNPEAFAEGILSVINNKMLSQRLSLNALHTAKKFSINNIVNNIETLYNSI